MLAALVSFGFRSSCELSRGEFLSEAEEEKGRKKRRASVQSAGKGENEEAAEVREQ